MSPHTDAGALLPCPFCGGKAAIKSYGEDAMMFKAECQECTALIRGFDQCSQDAVDAWNARQAASHGSAGGDVDPADIWDAYCEEVPAKSRSPQGAMAFAIDRLSNGAAQAQQEQIAVAVAKVLATDIWPVNCDYDDAGLSEGGYVQFVSEVISALPSAQLGGPNGN